MISVADLRRSTEKAALVLLFLFLGYLALVSSIENRKTAYQAGAVLALVGIVNVPIIHFSVEWWNTCLLYTSPSPRDLSTSRMPSSA